MQADRRWRKKHGVDISGTLWGGFCFGLFCPRVSDLRERTQWIGGERCQRCFFDDFFLSCIQVHAGQEDGEQTCFWHVRKHCGWSLGFAFELFSSSVSGLSGLDSGLGVRSVSGVVMFEAVQLEMHSGAKL